MNQESPFILPSPQGLREKAGEKGHIVSKHNGYEVDKGDPFSFTWEISSKAASRVWDLDYDWDDGESRFAIPRILSPDFFP